MEETPSKIHETKSTSPVSHSVLKSTLPPVSTEDQRAEQQYVVGWEQPEDEDPENPLNWNRSKKWSIIGVLTFLSFLV